MPIRDLFILLIVLAALPVSLGKPWIGVLTWSWLAYMSPHRLSWGFITTTPVAQAVAVATLVGFVATRERKRFVMTPELALIMALWAWFTVTSLVSLYPDDAWPKWIEFSKSILMALLTVALFQDRERLRTLLLVIAGSIAFFGFKGGIFALVTGGESKILGPDGTFLEANTDIALAMNMVLPILVYLGREEQRRWMRLALRMVFVFTVIAIPFTYSRGGVIGLVVVLCLLFLRARSRFVMLAVGAVGLWAFLQFAPQQWTDRMNTLTTHVPQQQTTNMTRMSDPQSASELRFLSWRVATRIAQDHPVVGGGFRVMHHREIYDRYMPEYPRGYGHDAHSIYFNFMADHGWVGLALFTALMASTFVGLRRLRKTTKTNPETVWIAGYASMIQVSLIAWLLNGAFLSVAYFDLAYHLIIVAAVLRLIAAAPPSTSTPVKPVTAHQSGRIPLGLPSARRA